MKNLSDKARDELTQMLQQTMEAMGKEDLKKVPIVAEVRIAGSSSEK